MEKNLKFPGNEKKLVAMFQVRILFNQNSPFVQKKMKKKHSSCRLVFAGAGDDVGMFLLIDAEPQEYYSFIRSYYGIQVEIHAQDDYPEMGNPIIVQPGYSARVLISPSVVNTDENVRRLPLSQRQCLFDDEVLHAIFK